MPLCSAIAILVIQRCITIKLLYIHICRMFVLGRFARSGCSGCKLPCPIFRTDSGTHIPVRASTAFITRHSSDCLDKQYNLPKCRRRASTSACNLRSLQRIISEQHQADSPLLSVSFLRVVPAAARSKDLQASVLHYMSNTIPTGPHHILRTPSTINEFPDTGLPRTSNLTR